MFLLLYGFFLSMSIVRRPTMMITTIMAATPAKKYWSAADGACVGATVGVGCSACTFIAVTAYDDQ